MIKKIIILLLTIFSFSRVCLAEIYISEVNVDCKNEEGCEDYVDKFKKAIGKYEGVKDFNNRFKYLLFEDKIHKLSFTLTKTKNDFYIMNIKLLLRKEIKEVTFEVQDEIDGVNFSKLTALKAGEFYSEEILEADKRKILRYLRDKGYFRAVVRSKSADLVDGILISFSIDLGTPVLIKDIIVKSSSQDSNKKIYRKFKIFRKKPADVTALKLKVEEISSDLKAKGFFFSKTSLIMPKIDENTKSITPEVNINLGERFVFGIHGNKKISKITIIDELKHAMREKARSNIERGFKKIILDLYERKGFWDTKVSSRILSVSQRGEGESIKRFYFDIKEGSRVFISKVNFINNQVFSDTKILNMYIEKGSSISSRMFLDENFARKFQQILQDEYVRNGQIFAKVKLRKIKRKPGESSTELEYFIEEGVQTVVQEIRIPEVPEILRVKLLNSMINKEGKLFNPFKVDSDLNTVQNEIKKMGYVFASISTKHPRDIVKYSADFKKVSIIIDLDIRNRIRLNEIIVGGNFFTAEKVVKREAGLSKDDLISPASLERFQNRLASLGIFANTNIDYIRINKFKDNDLGGKDEYVNVLVQVREKRAGFFEVAPGYRTDIGLKVSSAIGHNNVNGKNRGIRFQGQVNQRLNFDTLDARRRAAEKDKLEYSFKLNYLEPYLFNHPLAWQSSASISRKRFFSFDANISKANTSLRKSWTDNFSTSLSYQLEAIKQFDASNEIDEGFFRIGGITPGFTLDLRDNPVNPHRGLFLDWSVELANPSFYSLDREDLEINFYKFVMRNKFYLPLFDGVLAFSTSFGVQQNLAKDIITNSSGVQTTKGFIPSIKVFRLNGIDLVRGFDDDEINIVETGRDINDETVRDKAYFTNFRIEYRHFISDDIVIGSFFDGGRIYYESFTPHSFRSSTGLSLKYLTPVGSLDFDYGFKLHRKRRPDGKLESPGRFHVSIGFF